MTKFDWGLRDNEWGQVIIGLRGQFRIILRDEKGRYKRRLAVPNLITTTGKNMLAGILTGGTTPFTRNVAIGTGTTTPAAGDTTLTSEVGTRVSAGFAVTANTAYYSALFTANNPSTQQTIAEYGLFSLNAAGYIFPHSTAPAIIKETTDTLEVQYRVAIT